MKVLVSGGAGFIGSHIVEKLIARGDDVTVVDNLSTGKRENIPVDIHLIEMDIRDKKIEEIWKKEKFEVLIHLAAQMDVRKSVEDPVYDADINLLGFLNLMKSGCKNGLKRVLFASSGGAGYDNNVPFPTSEETIPCPISPYGIAKISTEMYLNYFSIEYGISYMALRLANVYGPRQNTLGEAGVVAIFCSRLLKNESITINGDGLQTRDYVYVDDVANAFIASLERDDNNQLNISTSLETNVVEIVENIKLFLDSDINPVFGPEKSGEVRRSCLDHKKASGILSWNPKVEFKTGIQKTVEYFKSKS